MPDSDQTFDLSDEAGWPASLTENHRRFLAERAVSPEVATARGYTSVTARSGSGANDLGKYGWGKKNELRQQIDSKRGQAVLVIPLYDATRTAPSTHQARADVPRIKPETGKPVKYEAPHGVKRGPNHGDLPADVNPMRASEATDTDAPLFITEGIPKADSVLSAAIAEGIDLVPVALTGVTMGYEVTDGDGASMDKVYELSPSLANIVEGRETVYLCWDSDWADNPMVRSSLVRTGHLLRKAGVEDVIYLGVPTGDGDADKAGVDDWLAAGGKLTHLLTACQMPEPEPTTDDSDDEEALEEVFRVDDGRRTMWDWEMKRIGSNPKPSVTKVKKFGAIAHRVDTVSECRVVDEQLRAENETFTIRVEWLGQGPNGQTVKRSADIDVPVAEFGDVRGWLGSNSSTAGLRISPSRHEQGMIANTISLITEEKVIAGEITDAKRLILANNGFYFHPPGQDADRGGFRYTIGSGWIGSPPEVVLGDQETNGLLPAVSELEPSTGTDVTVSVDSEARFCDPLLDGDYSDMVQEWRAWFKDWVFGEVVDRLGEQEPHRFGARTDDERRHLDDLKRRLVFGAVTVARSLLPGAPALGPTYLVGPPGSGKTLLARVWTSCFGERFGDKPYLSFGSTSAGVEVKLADARNMCVLVDDFHPSSTREMESMGKVIDQIARGAYDGAVKSRSTRDLKAMAAPQISSSVILTGEELPSLSTASNSVVQRLITLEISHQSAPAYEIMNLLAQETERQRRAVGVMIGAVARRLDEAADADQQMTHQTVSSAISKVRTDLEEWQDVLVRATSRRVTDADLVNPTERTKLVFADLLLGGSLLINLAHDLGLVSEPDESNAIVQQIADAMSWAMTETARTVSDTAPTTSVVEMIGGLLAHGRGHLVTVFGGAPMDETSLTWGWRKRPDLTWEKGGEHVGFVVQMDDEFLVAINQTPLAKALRQWTDDREHSASRLRQALSQAVDSNGQPVLAYGGGLSDPRRSVSINGLTQKLLLFRPETLGVKIDSLGIEAGADANVHFLASKRAARPLTIEDLEDVKDVDGIADMSNEDYFDYLDELDAAEDQGGSN